jgi:hypothetical protein
MVVRISVLRLSGRRWRATINSLCIGSISIKHPWMNRTSHNISCLSVASDLANTAPIVFLKINGIFALKKGTLEFVATPV